MDFSDPKFWFMVLNFLFTGLLTLVVYVRKPGEEAGKAINALSDRVSRLEETLKHMPTNEELARLYGELRECNARVEHLVEGQRRSGNQFDRIEQFLMSNK